MKLLVHESLKRGIVARSRNREGPLSLSRGLVSFSWSLNVWFFSNPNCSHGFDTSRVGFALTRLVALKPSLTQHDSVMKP